MNGEKRVVKIKRRKEERLTNINLDTKETKKIKKVTVRHFSDFYANYIKECPDTQYKFINEINGKILMLYYTYKYGMYSNDSEKAHELLKILSTFQYKEYIELYLNNFRSRLKDAGLLESIETNMNKLHEVLYWLINIKGQKVEGVKSSDLLKMRTSITNYVSGMVIKEYKPKNVMILKDGVILGTSEELPEYNSSLEGTIIMIEFGINKFVSVPANYYKKLYNIKKVVIDYEIAAIPHDRAENDPYDEKLLCSERTCVLKDVLSIITFFLAMEAREITFSDIVTYEIGTYLEYTEFDLKIITKDGDKLIMTENEFKSEYLGFLGVEV